MTSLKISRLAVGLFGLHAWAGGLGAQSVRLEITSESGGRPIPGALISLERDGLLVLRALADDAGRLGINAEPGRYALRVDAIGFKGKGGIPIEVEAERGVVLRVALVPQPLQLEELVVASGPRACRERSGPGVERLWEEARKALLSTQATRERPPEVEMRTFERALDRAGRIKEETSSRHRGFTDRPFHALEPAVLSKRGFVEERDDGVWYHGPDADLLLSDEFLADHCLSVGPERREDGNLLVSLAFEPKPARSLPDIAGELWLDVATSELRRIEYRYRNVELPDGGSSVGGRIELERLASGAWIVSDWVIRMPLIYRVRLQTGHRDSLAGFRETGGEARMIVNGRGLEPERIGGIPGRVVDSTTGVGLPGVRVSIQNGRFADTTGADGRFNLRATGRGAYLVAITDPKLELFGIDTLFRGASLLDQAPDTLLVAVPLFERAVRTLCPADTARLDRGMLIGRVVDSASGRPLGEIGVDLRYTKAISITDNSIAEQAVRLETVTNQEGYFRACGLPVGREIVVVATPQGGSSTKRIAQVDDSRLSLFTVRLP
ncbi:MAG: hypothetical protein AB7R55_21335 [Gemmatimonadales bacterium]